MKVELRKAMRALALLSAAFCVAVGAVSMAYAENSANAEFSLTYQANPAGAATFPGAPALVEAGQQVSVTVQAGDGYYLDNSKAPEVTSTSGSVSPAWSVSSSNKDEGTLSFTMPSGNVNVVVTPSFERTISTTSNPQYTVAASYTSAGTGPIRYMSAITGTITAVPGYDIAMTPTVSYVDDQGTTHTLTAGVTWTPSADKTSGTLVFAMPDGDVKVSVMASALSYNITAITTPEGSVTFVNLPKTKEYGETVSFEAQTAQGYLFNHTSTPSVKYSDAQGHVHDVTDVTWTVNSGDRSAMCDFTMPAGNVEIDVAPDALYTLTAHAVDDLNVTFAFQGNTGTATATTAEYKGGDEVTVTVTAGTGVTLSREAPVVVSGLIIVSSVSWSVNGNVGTCTFTMPSGNARMNVFDSLKTYTNTAATAPIPDAGTISFTDTNPAQGGTYRQAFVQLNDGIRFDPDKGIYITSLQPTHEVPVSWHQTSQTSGWVTFVQPFADAKVVVPVVAVGWSYNENNGRWQYRGDSGALACNEWLWIDGAWYFFGADTYLVTSQWLFDDNWYYVQADGVMARGIWDWIGDGWYGFNWDGSMCTGWTWDNSYGSWFFCDYYTGRMYMSCWAWLGDAWYGFWANGTMCTGWTWDNAWYYCDPSSGYMYINRRVDSVWWADASGVCSYCG